MFSNKENVTKYEDEIILLDVTFVIGYLKIQG